MKTLSLLGVLASMMISTVHANEITTYGGRGENCHTDRMLCKAHPGEERRVLQCHANVINSRETSSCTQEIRGCAVYLTCETYDDRGNVTSSFQDSCN